MGRYFRLLASTVAAVVGAGAISVAFTLVIEHTPSGQAYKVNAQHARQFKGFIDEYERTYGAIRGHLGCYSMWGHVRMSQHHIGNACDFGQLGWNATVNRPMYRIGWLARKWGLRDGCSFRDCGHIDAGGPGWVNGGPAGMVASAEIRDPSGGTKVAGEWPVALPVKHHAKVQVAARKSPFKLASLETAVVKPASTPPSADWLLDWNADKLRAPGWGEYAQLVDQSPTYFPHSGDRFPAASFPARETPKPHLAFTQHKKHHHYSAIENYVARQEALEKEQAAVDRRYRVGKAGQV